MVNNIFTFNNVKLRRPLITDKKKPTEYQIFNHIKIEVDNF